MEYKELRRVICPQCNSVDYKKNGYYSCKDGTMVSKYFCKVCDHHFSAQHEAEDKHLRRRDIMKEIATMYDLGYSHRAIAKEVGCAKKTVDRAIARLKKS